MRFVKYEDIIVLDGRIRKMITDVDVALLANNIEEKGLFHPILLQHDGKTLVAGETRLRAMIQLHKEGRKFKYNGEEVPPSEIPTTSLSDLGDIKVKEAELEENDIRTSLTWQERSMAIAQLHELREMEAEAEGRVHLKKDTAIELSTGDHAAFKGPNQAQLKVSRSLLLADHMDDEEVRKAKSEKDALKVIDRKLKQQNRERLAETFKTNPIASQHTLIHGDLIVEMPKFPEDSFECIIADPPYGIGADTFKNQSAVKHSYEDSENYADNIMKVIFKEGMRCTSPQAHLYMFHDVRRFNHIKGMAEKEGWYVWPWPLIWFRGLGNGLLPRPNHGPRRTYESILYCIKGDKETQSIGPDVLLYNHDRTTERGAHKPIDLYKELIDRSCLPGDRVLDPSCGSAPILSAATRSNVIATAIEIEDDGFGFAVERLKNEQNLEPMSEDELLAQFTEKEDD